MISRHSPLYLSYMSLICPLHVSYLSLSIPFHVPFKLCKPFLYLKLLSDIHNFLHVHCAGSREAFATKNTLLQINKDNNCKKNIYIITLRNNQAKIDNPATINSHPCLKRLTSVFVLTLNFALVQPSYHHQVSLE